MQKLDEPITVYLIYDADQLKLLPCKLVWRRRPYPITKIGLHHAFRTGRTLYHVYSVITDNLFMRLEFNTDNLQWHLTEIADRDDRFVN